MLSCKKCLLEKEEINFHKSSRNKSGFNSYCKDCRSLIDKESYKNSKDRKLKIKSNSDSLKEQNRNFVKRYKKYCGCLICKIKEPIVLDLHHLDPLTKDKGVSQLTSYSRSKLKEEIKKCVVVCSNCHRLIHAGIINIAALA